MIDCVVAPFDQRYDDAAGAESTTLPPEHNVVGPFAGGLAAVIFAYLLRGAGGEAPAKEAAQGSPTEPRDA